jgi:hypothetical protein
LFLALQKKKKKKKKGKKLSASVSVTAFQVTVLDQANIEHIHHYRASHQAVLLLKKLLKFLIPRSFPESAPLGLFSQALPHCGPRLCGSPPSSLSPSQPPSTFFPQTSKLVPPVPTQGSEPIRLTRQRGFRQQHENVCGCYPCTRVDSLSERSQER